MADNNITEFVLATGALGTAAFGIVEASKWLRLVGEQGFGAAWDRLGALTDALKVAYGDDHERMLRGLYRGDQPQLVRVLRQGVRVGLTPENATRVAHFLGSIDGEALGKAVRRAQEAEKLTTAERSLIGRYELAADARIDAALAVAQADYTGGARLMATVVSILIAVVAQLTLEIPGVTMTKALLVGIAAVPIAPIAKDVASGLTAATRALKAKV